MAVLRKEYSSGSRELYLVFAVYLETKREHGATLSDLMPDIQISLINMGFLANGCDSKFCSKVPQRCLWSEQAFCLLLRKAKLHTGNKVREEVRYKAGRMSLVKFLKRQPIQYPNLYSCQEGTKKDQI